MQVIIGMCIGVIIGIGMMCILQSNKMCKLINIIEYLKRVEKTNRKGNSEYDKGYSDGIKYAYIVFEEEL